MFSFAYVKSLSGLTNRKINLALPLRVCCECKLTGDAKETPRKKTRDKEGGQSECPSNRPK